jgi:integration host factor subunit alpha
VIKKDIAYRVQKATGLSLAKAEEAVEAVLAEMKNALASGEGVNIICFGGFHVADKNPRPGSNPRTGEAVIIPARKVVTFRASEKLKESVDHQPPGQPEPT